MARRKPLNSADQASVEFWARLLFAKKYEYLGDEEAIICQEAVSDFVLQWRDEMDAIVKGGE